MKVQKILDEVTTEMCDNYCKMPEKWQQEHGAMEHDDDWDEFYEEVCTKCPLNRL